MIIGTGVDITEVRRIKQAHEKWGEDFLQRVFTESEIKNAKTKTSFYQHLAGRFAAKEAVFKAAGDKELSWQDIQIHNDRDGKPICLFLNGRGKILTFISLFHMLKPMRLPTQLLRRKVNSHKGDYGHILILAGSNRFSGAALLCAEAALRAGAGLVTLGIPKGINQAIIRNKPKEIMTLPLPETREGTLGLTASAKATSFLKNADVLIIGPGLGKNRSTYALIRSIIKKITIPAVIDADALNALNNYPQILKSHKGEMILTPHEMEMSRLFSLDVNFIKKNRKLVAKKCAKYYNSVIVLKGHNSVVTDGNKNVYINKTGNPGMASAGSGDVLSGIVGAFLSQGLDGFKAAKYATYIHGLAGDIAALDKTQMGLIASDIIQRIPDAIKKSS